jgi:hypothetical protein
MSHDRRAKNPSHPSRRELLQQLGGGLGGIALASLLQRETRAQDPARRAALHAARTHAPRAQRVIQLFMAGGASHLDLWDWKPELVRRHGKPSDFGEAVETFQDGLGPWLKPIWDFAPYGQCGKRLGEPVAKLGAHVDDIAFVHDMVSASGVHSQATLLATTGFALPGFPSAGAWVSYGLGSANDDLPTFVVLPDHRGHPSNGSKNWDAAFLPGQHGATAIYPGTATPIAHLHAARASSTQRERATHELLHTLNRSHAAARPDDARLEARIASYELAARLQLAAPEALDLRDEPEHVLRLYGLERGPQAWGPDINDAEESYVFALKCLVARRLIERGVRFVQLWSGNDNSFPRRNWDSHEDIRRDHGPLASGMARGAAALLTDLKRRGLLEDTVVHWTTEFGRMPSSQGGKGRDHNPFVYTQWLCGGGVRGGVSVGESDELGFKPRDRKGHTTYDLHATLLHLLGLDHEQLTWKRDGIERRLTDVHGHVIPGLLA